VQEVNKLRAGFRPAHSKSAVSPTALILCLMPCQRLYANVYMPTFRACRKANFLAKKAIILLPIQLFFIMLIGDSSAIRITRKNAV